MENRIDISQIEVDDDSADERGRDGLLRTNPFGESVPEPEEVTVPIAP